MTPFDRLAGVLPVTATVNAAGHLAMADCDLVELARQHRTPLYVFDEATLRLACREWKRSFSSIYPETSVAYAAKAFFNLALAGIIRQEGLGVDVASLGELEAAIRAAFPRKEIVLHGNNKGRQELELAARLGIGAVVIDGADELALVRDVLASTKGARLAAMVRVNPNIDPHTHAYISTGRIDSKFGLAIQSGQAEEVVAEAMRTPGLDIQGLHFHLGSQLFDVRPYELAIAQILRFAAHLRDHHGFRMRRFSPGGGYGVRYTTERPASPQQFAEAVVRATRAGVEENRLEPLRLTIEAGRSIIARAGLALYTVGSVKRIPEARTYVAVDGGMGDNIRPALYGARYPVLSANRPLDVPDEWVRVVGKYCESGDILIHRARLARPAVGDLLCIPMSGAYAPAMASNYNLSMRPAILLAAEGEARVIRRRETLDDLLRLESDVQA